MITRLRSEKGSFVRSPLGAFDAGGDETETDCSDLVCLYNEVVPFSTSSPPYKLDDEPCTFSTKDIPGNQYDWAFFQYKRLDGADFDPNIIRGLTMTQVGDGSYFDLPSYLAIHAPLSCDAGGIGTTDYGPPSEVIPAPAPGVIYQQTFFITLASSSPDFVYRANFPSGWAAFDYANNPKAKGFVPLFTGGVKLCPFTASGIVSRVLSTGSGASVQIDDPICRVFEGFGIPPTQAIDFDFTEINGRDPGTGAISYEQILGGTYVGDVSGISYSAASYDAAPLELFCEEAGVHQIWLSDDKDTVQPGLFPLYVAKQLMQTTAKTTFDETLLLNLRVSTGELPFIQGETFTFTWP